MSRRNAIFLALVLALSPLILYGGQTVQNVFLTDSAGSDATDTVNHAVRVNVVQGGGTGGTSSSFGSAYPGVGTAVGGSNGTNMVPLNVDGSGNLKVNVQAGAGSGFFVADQSSFTAGTSSVTPVGCAFQTSPSTLANNQIGDLSCTSSRALRTMLTDSTGVEISNATAHGIKVAGIDSGGSDITDTTNHALKVNVVAGSLLSPASFGSPFPATGMAIGFKDSAGTNLASGNLDASGNLKVAIAAGGGSGGTAQADNSSFTVNTTNQTPMGCLYESSPSSLTSGRDGAVGCGVQRNLKVMTTDSTGADATDATNHAVRVSVVASSIGATPCTNIQNISQTSSARVIVGTSAKKTYICGIVLVSATAQNVSLVAGTGSTCGTGTNALMGSTSGSMALAANSGFSSVSPYYWLPVPNTADDICLVQSGAGNVSGAITYFQN